MFKCAVVPLVVVFLAESASIGAPIHSVAFSTDGRQIVAGCGKDIVLWDVGTEIKSREFRTAGPIWHLVFSAKPDVVFGILADSEKVSVPQDDEEGVNAFIRGKLVKLDLSQPGGEMSPQRPHAGAVSGISFRKSGEVVTFGGSGFTVWNHDLSRKHSDDTLLSGASSALQIKLDSYKQSPPALFGHIASNATAETWYIGANFEGGGSRVGQFHGSTGMYLNSPNPNPIESLAVTSDGTVIWLSNNRVYVKDSSPRMAVTTSHGPIAAAGAGNQLPLKYVVLCSDSPQVLRLSNLQLMAVKRFDGRWTCVSTNPADPNMFVVGTFDGKAWLVKFDSKKQEFDRQELHHMHSKQ